jgi:hypothetical protein
VRSSVPASPAAAAMLVLSLSCILLLAGCGQEEKPVEKAEEEAGVEEVADERGLSTEVELEPVDNSGTNGSAAFSETPEGVEVALSVQGLPDPKATYLSHIHPGTCDEKGRERRPGSDADHSREEESQEADIHKGEADHDAEHGSEIGEIEYPLMPVSPDAEGTGSSTTVLEGVTPDELFSGEPKYVNAHASGSGDSPVLACGDLSP